MKITRAAAVPLITFDPYFSLWCKADTLSERAVSHWTDRVQALDGLFTVDGKTYRWMGVSEHPSMRQVSLDVTATSTTYVFEAEGARLTVRFTCPLLLREPELVSRSCAYLDYTVESDLPCTITVIADENHCHTDDAPAQMQGGVFQMPHFDAAWMGSANQRPLGHSGDNITIDWGYLYLAGGTVSYLPADETRERSVLQAVSAEKAGLFLIAYDDTASINYFGVVTRAYWARNGKTMLTAMDEAWLEHNALIQRCNLEDEALERNAKASGGDDYAYLCILAYRQSIAAHKIIADENGELVFLSKENNSNGCIGTVDVSYPSIPLYLCYNPEYVRGMMRPIFRFASCPVWKYDFAPHDVGRYPYATGQIYASNYRAGHGTVHPPVYQFPENCDVYRDEHQMPVEESGNLLIMAAAVTLDDDGAFIRPYMDMLSRWVGYLLRYGADPANQLCTDDFAGHLAHNVNLSAKAILGIASYGMILDVLGREGEAKMYFDRAGEMAADWEKRADAGDRTVLAFDRPDSWSLKYNTVWDKMFGLKLFSDAFYTRETAWYLKVQNRYGVPLDSRETYTKTDWILWCAAFAGEKRGELIAPVAQMMRETPDREAFTDWYYTKDAIHRHFRARSVIGGVFMPMLYDRMTDDPLGYNL